MTMGGKLLQAVGVIALLGLCAAGAAALFVVKGRVRLVVQDDAQQAIDGTALLRDDVHALRADLAALTQALGDNLAGVLRQIEQNGEQQRVELRAELAGLGELRRNAVATAARLQAIELALQRAAAASPPAAVAVPQDEPPIGIAMPALEAAPPADPAAPEPEVAGGSTEAAPPPRRSFLSFRLPDRAFVFDQEQQFDIVPELSRVGFDAVSTLHDFSGVTSKVRGSVHANLADPQGAWTGAVVCDAGSLVTGVDGRDAAMREHLDTAQFAEIRFAIEGFASAADGIDVTQQTVRGEVRGRMTIRGVERELRLPVHLHIDDGRRLVIEGEARLRLPDYGVPVPSQLGVIHMQDEVRIWIALRARATAGGAGGR